MNRARTLFEGKNLVFIYASNEIEAITQSLQVSYIGEEIRGEKTRGSAEGTSTTSLWGAPI